MYLQLMIKPISWHWTGMVAHFYQSKINKYIIKKKSKKKRFFLKKKKKKNSKKKRLENGVQKGGPQKPTDF